MPQRRQHATFQVIPRKLVREGLANVGESVRSRVVRIRQDTVEMEMSLLCG